MAIEEKQYLDPDGLKEVINQTDARYATKDLATTSASGLMSSSDKTKLNSVESGANKTIIDSALSSTSTNPVQNKLINAVLIEIDSAIDALETLVGEKSVATQIAEAFTAKNLDQYATDDELAQAIEDAKADAANKDAVVLAEAQSGIAAVQAAVDAHTAKADIHVTAEDKTNWNAAAAKAHEHSNLSVLEALTAAKIAAWDAKANAATTLAGYGITDAYTKTETDTAIANAVAQFVEVSEEEINALFA